jgi:hypothetical protein
MLAQVGWLRLREYTLLLCTATSVPQPLLFRVLPSLLVMTAEHGHREKNRQSNALYP